MINLQQARDLLKRAVDTQGADFVYSPHPGAICWYKPMDPTDTPIVAGPDDPRTKTGCLVGVALDLAGETRHRDSPGTVFQLTLDYPDMMTPDAMHYFSVAQEHQDGGRTWGEAYRQAEAAIV